MLEEEVRAAFARHEHLTPAAGPLRATIDRMAVRRRRRRLTIRAAGAALVVVAATAVPGYASRLAGQAEPYGLGDTVPPVVVDPAPQEPLNALLLGLDSAAGRFPVVDMIFILHVPADRSRAYVLSLPRDLVVTPPAAQGSQAVAAERGRTTLPEIFEQAGRRAGGALPVDGLGRVADTLAGQTGLRLDAAAAVELSALRSLTDAVGGVRMCLDEKLLSVLSKRQYPRGCQRLDGTAGVDVLRQRYGPTGEALDRDRNGRQYLKALLASARASGAMDDVPGALKLVAVAGDGLTVDPPGGDLTQLVQVVRGSAAEDVVGIAFPADRVPEPPASADPRMLDDLAKEQMAREAKEKGPLIEPRRIDAEPARALFEAIAGDRIGRWLASNPNAAD